MVDTSRPLNFVVILADDHRADWLGCAGHPLVKTPHLDRLAAEGVRFRNAVCTSPLCTPSRVCYQLSQWEKQHAVTFNSGFAVPSEAWEDSYPRQLRKAGCFVGYVGKNHSPVGAGGYGSGLLERSFDYWYANHNHSGFYPKDSFPQFNNAAAQTQAEVFAEGMDNFFAPDDAWLAGTPFLKKRPEGRPYCLCLNFNLPHRFGTSKMELRTDDDELYRTAYRDVIDRLDLPETYVPFADEPAQPKLPRNVYSREQITSYDYTHDEASWREHAVRYMQTITGIDRVVGRVLAHLERRNELENTVIFYGADHGIMAGEHGLGGKTLLYEESLRIPYIVRDPRLSEEMRGRTSGALVVPQDVGPTLLAAAGVDIPTAMRGRDLAPLLRDESAAWRDAVFCENGMTIQAYPRTEAVREGRWKYIRYFKRDAAPAPDQRWDQVQEDYAAVMDNSINGEPPNHEELYDLERDPRETRNLIGDPVHADEASRLRVKCQAMAVEARGAGERRVAPA